MPLLGPREQIADRHRCDVERGSAGIEPGQVEQIVDDPFEPLRLDADDVHGLLARPGRWREVGQGQRLGVAADRGQRRAQLVGHVGQQLAPGPIGLDEGGLAGAGFIGHAVERGRHGRHLVTAAGRGAGGAIAVAEAAHGALEIAEPGVRRPEDRHRRQRGAGHQQPRQAGGEPRRQFARDGARRPPPGDEHRGRYPVADTHRRHGPGARAHRPRRARRSWVAVESGPRRTPASEGAGATGRPRRLAIVAGQPAQRRPHQRLGWPRGARRHHAAIGEDDRRRAGQIVEPRPGQIRQVGLRRARRLGGDLVGHQRRQIGEQARRQRFVPLRRQPQEQGHLGDQRRGQERDEAGGDAPVEAAIPAARRDPVGIRHRRTCNRRPTP